MIDKSFWAGKNVVVTGHSGFKGNWLVRTLLALGSNVHGYSDAKLEWLGPDEAGLYGGAFTEEIGDINDGNAFASMLSRSRPEILFHLAAQALVIDGYRDPVKTFMDNVVGTATVIQAARDAASLEAIIIATSDKCYLNEEQSTKFVEEDRLGGEDPYSASKACAEIATASFMRSFFHGAGSPGIATVRAGNVIGGLDWSANRLLPDLFRALHAEKPLVIRHPEATRPWQFVMEPLMGYIMLAERLAARRQDFSGAWNFGPQDGDVKTVSEIIRLVEAELDGPLNVTVSEAEFKEATYLTIDSGKAMKKLGWSPKLTMQDGIRYTASWYQGWLHGADTKSIVQNQIKSMIIDGTH